MSVSKRALSVVGAAGLVGGVVVGGTMVATAADPTPVYQNQAITCVGTTSVPAPAVPVYTTRLIAGATKVSGTATPSPTLFQGVVPTGYRLEITTQYDTTKSGAGKTDVATVTLPGHVFTNPLLFNIPPVTNTLLLGASTATTTTSAPATDSTPFTVQTSGKAFATVTVNLFVASATTTTTTTVLGSTCPTGTTKGANYLQGLNAPRPAAPTNVRATAGSTTLAPSGTAPNNGDATVSFTAPTADPAAGQILGYEVVAHNTTNATTPDVIASYPVTSTTATAYTEPVTGLNTASSYTFTVEAFTDSAASVASTPSTPAITPTVGTGTGTLTGATSARK